MSNTPTCYEALSLITGDIDYVIIIADTPPETTPELLADVPPSRITTHKEIHPPMTFYGRIPNV